jgi:hypothetical protein
VNAPPPERTSDSPPPGGPYTLAVALGEAGGAIRKATDRTLRILATLSGGGRGVWRPILWLVLVNLAAHAIYRAHIKATTMQQVGRTARSWWGRTVDWVGGLFGDSASTPAPAQAVSAAQEKALLDFTLGGATPFGPFSRAVYERAIETLFKGELAAAVQLAQLAQGWLNLLFVALLAVAVRRRASARR